MSGSVLANHNDDEHRTSKTLAYFFTPKYADMDRRYHTGLDNAYNSDWEYPYWTPYDWAQNEQTARVIIEGFFKNGVIERYYIDPVTKTRVLAVGQTWLDMSGRDKRRVVKFMAFAYGADQRSEAIELVLHRNKECYPMGIYIDGDVQLH